MGMDVVLNLYIEKQKKKTPFLILKERKRKVWFVGDPNLFLLLT